MLRGVWLVPHWWSWQPYSRLIYYSKSENNISLSLYLHFRGSVGERTAEPGLRDSSGSWQGVASTWNWSASSFSFPTTLLSIFICSCCSKFQCCNGCSSSSWTAVRSNHITRHPIHPAWHPCNLLFTCWQVYISHSGRWKHGTNKVHGTVMTKLMYEVCLKSNKTGAIKFFINNWTTIQLYPLQSSSFGKPHTAGDVAPIPGSSAGSLHVEVPSAGLSWPFECCPQFQNDDLWGGFWVLGKGRSHTYSDQASMGGVEPLEYPFWSKIHSWRWQRDGEHCCAASKCLQSLAGHDEPFFWVVLGHHYSTVD